MLLAPRAMVVVDSEPAPEAMVGVGGCGSSVELGKGVKPDGFDPVMVSEGT